jgi:Uma2 family endonuclease
MSTITQAAPHPEIEYPDSDGRPMADNTKQFRWIVTITGGLDAQFADDPGVFVAGDLFWYPVEGDPTIRTAPDTLVVFGRPKGDRGSYKQWEEGNIAPQVVFEIWSPGNRIGEMTRKFQFYERYGVDEYYLYDPDENDLMGWRRLGDRLVAIATMNGWTSPLLRIRFALEGDTMAIYGPDGHKFSTYAELEQQRKQERELRLASEAQLERLRTKLREAGVDPEV